MTLAASPATTATASPAITTAAPAATTAIASPAVPAAAVPAVSLAAAAATTEPAAAPTGARSPLDARTLTDRALAAHADRVVHAASACARPWLRDDELAVAWQGDRGLFTNTAVVLAEPEGEGGWHRVVERIAQVVPLGRPVSLVSAAPVPDLSDRGWISIGRPPFMVRPAGGSARPAPAELTVSAVVDEPSLEVFERTLVDGYPEPRLQPYEWGRVHDGRVLGGPLHLFTGFVAGRPVATAGAHVAHGVNLVEFVATMADARGRGYGEALTWAATLVDPSLPAVLIASDHGRPVYERMGYLPVARWSFVHRMG